MLIVAEEHPENFLPLSLTRATFELRYGALCPLDRALLVAEKSGRKIGLRARPELAQYLRAKTGFPVNEDIAAGGEEEICAGLPAQTPWDILAQSDKLITADWDLWNHHHRNLRPKRLPGVHIMATPSMFSWASAFTSSRAAFSMRAPAQSSLRPARR